jgi:uncharacterized protein (TIGR02147 family)
MNNTDTQISENLVPQIKKYSNVLSYLSDYFEYRKGTDSKFTYDLWSAELGFKSRSFMYLICSGRRTLTPPFVNTLAKSLNLSLVEKNHLLLLACYQRAKTSDLKAIFFDKILENLEQTENQMNAIQFSKFVGSSTMPLVKMILSFDDIKGTEAEILSILPIDKKTLAKDLIELEKMDLIKKTHMESTQDIIWKATSKAFHIPDDRSNDIMDLFHFRTMNEAADLSMQKNMFKKFRSILFAIDPKDHKLLLSEIESFLSKMKNRFGYNDIKGKHIVKLNLQAYPTTKVSNSF